MGDFKEVKYHLRNKTLEFNYGNSRDERTFQLCSSKVATQTNYCVGFKYNNGLHLCPIESIHHMRPNFDKMNPKIDDHSLTVNTEETVYVTDINDHWIDCKITNYVNKNKNSNSKIEKEMNYQAICQNLIDLPNNKNEIKRKIKDSMKVVELNKNTFLKNHFNPVVAGISQFCEYLFFFYYFNYPCTNIPNIAFSLFF